MSMLSAQCDELRAMAESIGLEVPQAATLMMEAADTILSLRDRAQELQAENAKLRELVRTLHHCAARGECDVCTMRDGRGLDEDTVCFAAHDRMRELGVEVEV